ncbi:MAG: exodeoxyribonuclease VII large subunit [Acidobacteria bacterium]|nr:exodeoxyribonuclease VII large subunit [Acidobacteriota bacterium]
MEEREQLGLSFEIAAARKIWSVGDLVSSARTSLEREYTDVWVEGEISNFRGADSGHVYFTLKDGDAQLRTVMFRSQARLLRFRPTDGLRVLARGRVTIYEARGELQLMAEYLDPKGAGALQVAFEQLKAKLATEGLFDAARKKPIPALPRRIGVVTSPRGAALQDILNILRRRHESVGLLIYPAQVQGDAAAGEVRAGIAWFNRARNVDVIIVARGGGSLEDLAAFNDEGMARAIASSQIPVISAVGHETDFTIADLVADLRAPTPSAAAEMVIESKHQIEERVLGLQQRLGRAARYKLLMARQAVDEWARHAAFARIREFVGRRQQRVDDLVYRLGNAEARILNQYRSRLDVASARMLHFDLRRQFAGIKRDLDARLAALVAAERKALLTRRSQFEQAEARLQALSPLSILDRGYALIFDAAGKLVKDSAQVEVGDQLSARVSRGKLGLRVDKKE